MKAILSVLILVAAFSFDVPISSAGTNYFGFRGGVNVATLEGDEPADIHSVTKPVLGVTGVFGLTSWLAFQCEVLYSGKGAEGSIPIAAFGDDTATGSLALGYLEIPLLLRCTPLQGGRWRPFLYGGPAFAANLTASADAKISNPFFPPTLLDNIEQVVTDGDLLLMAGLGVGMSLGRPVLELDARYSRGLIGVDESRRTIDPKNRTWGFTLALVFGPSS